MNIVEKFSKINKKIENLNESYWLLITFLICLVCIISLSPEIIWQPYIHAEDGPIFLKQTMQGGIGSLFNTFGGYFGVLPRLFALMALNVGKKYNSYIAVTFVMKTCATLFSVLVVSYFNSKEFKKIIDNRILRLLVSISLILVIANHAHMIYTTIMVHWWGDLLVLFIGFILLKKKMMPLYIVPLMILIILSSPVSLLIVIPLSYYIICKLIAYKKSDKDLDKKVFAKKMIKLIAIELIVIACIAEIYGMLVLSKNGNVQAVKETHLSVEYIWKTIVKTLQTMARCIPFIISRQLPQAMKNIFTENIQTIIGTILLLFMTWRYYKNKNMKLLVWGLIMMSGIYFMIYFKQEDYYKLPSDCFYNSIPSAVGILLLIKWIYDDMNKLCKEKSKLSKAILFVVLCLANIPIYNNVVRPIYKYCPNMYEVEKKVDFSSSQIEKVGISDKDSWKAYVPVKTK